MPTGTGDCSRARDRRHAVPERTEQGRLRSGFGAVLRVERGHTTQQMLADAAGLDRRSIDRLEQGQRRPSTVSVWRIARALRPGVRVHQGAARGPPQPLVESHRVAQRARHAGPQRPRDAPAAHRRRPAGTALQPVDGPPIQARGVGQHLLGDVPAFDPQHRTECAAEA